MQRLLCLSLISACCDSPLYRVNVQQPARDNAARLRDVDFITPDGEPACSQLWSAGRSGGELEPDRLYLFRPDGTKSQRAANIGRVPIKVLVECEQELCCAWWLQQCGLEYAAVAMKPLQGFLTDHCNAIALLLPTSQCPAPASTNAEDPATAVQHRRRADGHACHTHLH